MRTRTRLAALVMFVVGAAGLTGCGGGVPVDELGDALIDATCERFVRCNAVESREACLAQLDQLGGELLELQHGVADGTIDYDEGKVEDCLEALAAAPCDETLAAARDQPAACRDAIRGTIADGGACMISAQCQSGVCVTEDCPDACCEGTCAPTIPDAAVGAPCGVNGADCVAGAFCSEDNACAPLLAAGAPCAADDECGYGLHCANSTDTCVDAPNLGEACPDGGCADLGTFCASEVCAALPRRGEPCGPLGQCLAPNTCDSVTETCGPPPGVGQPCEFSCAAGAYCDFANDTCAAEKADGQACGSSRECASGYCDELSATCGVAPVCL